MELAEREAHRLENELYRSRQMASKQAADLATDSEASSSFELHLRKQISKAKHDQDLQQKQESCRLLRQQRTSRVVNAMAYIRSRRVSSNAAAQEEPFHIQQESSRLAKLTRFLERFSKRNNKSRSNHLITRLPGNSDRSAQQRRWKDLALNEQRRAVREQNQQTQFQMIIPNS